jgi:hypothetical protein
VRILRQEAYDLFLGVQGSRWLWERARGPRSREISRLWEPPVQTLNAPAVLDQQPVKAAQTHPGNVGLLRSESFKHPFIALDLVIQGPLQEVLLQHMEDSAPPTGCRHIVERNTLGPFCGYRVKEKCRQQPLRTGGCSSLVDPGDVIRVVDGGETHLQTVLKAVAPAHPEQLF